MPRPASLHPASLKISAHPAGIATRPLRRLIGLLAGAFSLRRQRLQLSRLDPRLCEDIGLSYSQAQQEAARPFWDAPDHWFRDRTPPL